MESGRLKELKKVRQLTADELKDLTGSDDANALPKASWLFKFLMPGLYAELIAASSAMDIKKGEIKAVKLQTKITLLELIKTKLETIRAGACLTDAFRKFITWIIELASTGLGIIIDILLILLSFIIIPVLAIYYFFSPAPLSLTGQIKDKIKRVKKILEPMKTKLVKAKREILLRRRLVQIDQAIASKRFNAQTPPGPGPNEQNTASEEQQAA